MKTIKKRGLFSKSSSTPPSSATGNSGSPSSSTLNTELDASITSESKSLKSPNSPNASGPHNSSSTINKHGYYNNSSNNILPPSQQHLHIDEDRFVEGVVFCGKLIGDEYVADARGEQMCQQSLKKLKVYKFII